MRIINTAEFVSPEDLGRLSPSERESMYNGLDCCVTLELLYTLLGELDSERTKIYQLSLDLRAPILEMSIRGIRVDDHRRQAVLREKLDIHTRVKANLDRILSEGLGLVINYRSGPALKNLFYSVLGIRPIRKRNAHGIMVPTVNRDALERLQSDHYATPLCLHIITLRELDKQISFLRTGIDPDGRMRSTFNIAGTNTGRLASSLSEFGTGTNMQNVDRSLRSIFIPDPGKKFINIDLEQGDSRNMGAMMWNIFYPTHGPAFAGAYLDACESSDLHVAVSKLVWSHFAWTGDPKADRAIADVLFYRLDSYRQVSKKLGHGTNYGGRPPTMAMHSKMPVKVIANFQDKYFEAFPCIPAYHGWIKEQLTEYRFIDTLYNRRRFFYGRTTEPSTLNEAIAFPSQSMTADAVNNAMIAVWRSGLAELLCQVHDSLLMQVPEEVCDERVPALLRIARSPLQLAGGREFCVPNEAKVGWNWADADKENPNGLMKWKDGDTRKTPTARKLSIMSRLS